VNTSSYDSIAAAASLGVPDRGTTMLRRENLACLIRHRIGACVLLLVVPAALAACSAPKPAQSGSEERESSGTGRVSQSRNGEVVVTGAVNTRYVPEDVRAVKIADRVGININEKENDPCGVSLAFPDDSQPGTYAIEDSLHALQKLVVVHVTGEYGAFCNTDGSLSGTFESTTGTLRLTASGAKFSGSFQFAAREIKDESKTIQVSGSFAGVPRP
jgi:hypothetical protein